jgi:hypothetical protein
MLRSKLSLVCGSFAAIAVGGTAGWAALALMPTRSPAVERTVSPQSIPVSASGTGEEATAARPAPAPPSPHTQPPEKPSTPQHDAAASGPTGVWFDHTGRGAVEINECGGSLCGRIVWLKDAANRGVCGKQIIGNAKRSSASTWDGGWIYDPDREARYSVELKLVGTDKLRVTGYMGSKLFSETYTWKRATEDLTRCDAQPRSASSPPAASDPGQAREQITKTEPSPDPTTESGTRPKSRSSSIADIEKIARDLMKGKSSGKTCRAKLPYVGTVTIPCSG